MKRFRLGLWVLLLCIVVAFGLCPVLADASDVWLPLILRVVPTPTLTPTATPTMTCTPTTTPVPTATLVPTPLNVREEDILRPGDVFETRYGWRGGEWDAFETCTYKYVHSPIILWGTSNGVVGDGRKVFVYPNGRDHPEAAISYDMGIDLRYVLELWGPYWIKICMSNGTLKAYEPDVQEVHIGDRLSSADRCLYRLMEQSRATTDAGTLKVSEYRDPTDYVTRRDGNLYKWESFSVRENMCPGVSTCTLPAETIIGLDYNYNQYGPIHLNLVDPYNP